MSKSNLSVGDDTPTGEPEVGPKGPYITDKSDDVVTKHKQPRREDKDAINHQVKK